MENHTENTWKMTWKPLVRRDCIGAIQRNHLNEGESNGKKMQHDIEATDERHYIGERQGY